MNGILDWIHSLNYLTQLVMTAWNICYFLHSKIKTSHYLLLGFLVSSLLVLLFKSHPSISLIKNEIINGNNFNFEPGSLGDIELEIGLLNPKEATTPSVCVCVCVCVCMCLCVCVFVCVWIKKVTTPNRVWFLSLKNG